ncbi:MAG: T9SS type A sorting domain-containing protein [Lewinellaceae bacterium]|nr:T9SS type A sorting domain-containing protein [Saprospiraceae bacterium]MCB9340196.1 T9SS type A sorting domain-containing protein [Lewinellaceae bacterium]
MKRCFLLFALAGLFSCMTTEYLTGQPCNYPVPEVLDVQGRVVLLGKIERGETKFQIKTGDWERGVYFLKLNDSLTRELIFSSKIVKH